MLTKSIINKAVEQNLVMFDEDSKPATLSYRLVAIMIDFVRKNYNGILTKLYIPRGISWDSKYPTFCGLKVYQVEELDINGEIYKYYMDELKGSLYWGRGGDKYLIVGIGPNDAVMLGSIE